ncbi:AfsA-related hotdog domain-containing protein, partial [Streptomyces sp. NPDC048568]|uniref:AfsA-related hotdog domain-containing protein n=1 Tax=Streptomyces sp. NPDC048568 TaxID=3365571 RepID=UPI00371382ED
MTASTFDTVRPPAAQPAPPTAPPHLPHLPHLPAVPGHGPWTSTVPSELVHRAAVAEVMLTDWQRLTETRYTMRAQWPRGHSFFTPLNGNHDPLIAAETIRQA